jgi:hypothetical protein
LQRSGDGEDTEAEKNRAQACARARDRAIDKAVRMTMCVRMVVGVSVTQAGLSSIEAGARRCSRCIETCSA